MARRTVGEKDPGCLGKISENAWDGQFPVVAGLPIGCFHFERSLVRQVCSANPEAPQKYAAVLKLWACCCSFLDKVTKHWKSCDCGQEEKAVSWGEI